MHKTGLSFFVPFYYIVSKREKEEKDVAQRYAREFDPRVLAIPTATITIKNRVTSTEIMIGRVHVCRVSRGSRGHLFRSEITRSPDDRKSSA